MSRVEALPSNMLAISGVVFCLTALAMTLFSPQAALIGWLAALVFMSALPLGALCLTMMMRIIPGIWRDELLTVAEPALLLLPLALLATLPIMIGLPWIYEWARGAPLGAFKKVYLTPFFFDARTLAMLSGGCWLAWALVTRPRRSLPLAAIGLIAFVLLHELLSVDWLMSLDPQFHSSGFGLYILASQMLTALSLLIVLRLSAAPVRRPGVLGGLLLTAILVWVYLAFMQYFIIWSGNLPKGVAWYQRRGEGIWAIAEYLITLLHLLPLLLLFFPPVRTSPAWLITLSLAVLAGALLEYAWLTMPELTEHLGPAISAYLLSLTGFTQIGLAVLSRSTVLLARLRPSYKAEVSQ
ncbi:hypothetical protein [Rhizobium leucaenae]|uniref:hypothetical protein n=1 Tax=Rhizobium leucaenae TaxID=29450 RepID=UPI001608DA01|nr:hypothetical protein [Rhizobium leucaenae]MBB6300611.1 hypothetical protein [Rhizobium leucaenae]